MYPLDRLIGDFASCLAVGETPLNSEYKQYLATVQLRKQFSSVRDAIADDGFLESLHVTLRGFFRLRRGRTPLLPLDQFKQELRANAQSIASFDGRKLSTEPTATCADLWKLINQLKLTTEMKDKSTAKHNPKLVSGTKALHLLLPDLVVPIDRRYTGAFLFRFNTDFDAGHAEHETFRIAFAVFQTIAKAVTPETYVETHPMHATLTKVIDNGVIGFIERTRADFQAFLS